MAEELGERTELPTERRRHEARQRGQVAKSQDLAGAIDLIFATVLIVAFGGLGLRGLGGVVRRALEGQTAGDPLDTASIPPLLAWAAAETARIAGPAMLAMLIVGVAAQLAQVGWLVTTDPLTPRLSRLNPLNGLKRIFGPRGLVRTGLNTAKLVLVLAVAIAVLAHRLPTVAGLAMLDPVPAMHVTGRLALELAAWLLALLLVLGLADWAYQRWQHTRDLRMTRQEVKEERRLVDGDPEVKGRRLRMARAIAMQKVQQAVPKADVVVTNPTHFSVALRYDSATMAAPVVVAKGADYMAFRIREVAAAHGVPIVERPPLARALYWGVEVGRPIKAEHYEAVAEVLAYVYRMEGRAA